MEQIIRSYRNPLAQERKKRNSIGEIGVAKNMKEPHCFNLFLAQPKDFFEHYRRTVVLLLTDCRNLKIPSFKLHFNVHYLRKNE